MFGWYLISRYRKVNGVGKLEPLHAVWCNCFASAIQVAFQRRVMAENDSVRVSRAITESEIELCRKLDREHVTKDLWPLDEFVEWMKHGRD